MRIAPITLALAGLVGAAAPAAERDPLDGRVAGKPVDCVDHARLGGPEIVDNRTLLYRDGRTIWRNDLLDVCPSLRPMATVIVELYGSQLCRNDHVRAQGMGSVIPRPVCRLGSFTPYDLPAK